MLKSSRKSRSRGLVPRLLFLAFVFLPVSVFAIGQTRYVENAASRGSFPLVGPRGAATLVVDSADWPGVIRAVNDLRDDVQRVTNVVPQVAHRGAGVSVLIGTLGKSPLIDQLVREKKIDVTAIQGKWESFFLQTVDNPVPGVTSALVIVGSDKRGTIYGIYDLSEQIGVSPWYWWADVTADHKDALYIKAGKYQQGEPSVKYRGIFFNDEKPDLDFWVRAKFGEHPSPSNPNATVANFDSKFYAKVFEVLLRLKGNYLWPAMWNNGFAEDDPDNPRLADEYGIVMGTSHQEPMLRAQKEWDWHQGVQLRNWNFATQERELTDFWRGAVQARKNFENIYTIGLRGENDTAMVQGQAESIRLLQRIVDVQRQMLREEIGGDLSKIPQVWALYKEVQQYYENGLRVPDDVTLLWAEDNWGNVRRLPTKDERARPGGAGVYYHFDYHGGPRSYQWINTNPISKIWDQMSLAKQYGADRIWIVNVGHFKGYEFPTEYFLDLAWNSNRWTNDNINEYTRLWAEREFGAAYAADVADVIAKYSKYNGRRKPELLDANTYSLIDGEFDTVVADYSALLAKAQSIYDRLPAAKKDAFYELALFPVKASANVNELYFAAAKNALYAQQGRASTNAMADNVRELFKADADLMTYFNKSFAGGKWDHFMDQSHIGYTSWQDPPQNNLNAIRLSQLEVGSEGKLGVALEGSRFAWPSSTSPIPALPQFDALEQQRRFIDLFNGGSTPYAFTITPSDSWIVVSETRGTVETDKRLWVSVDWARAPKGSSLTGLVTVSGAGREVRIAVGVANPADIRRETLEGFAGLKGIVSIEPEHYTRRNDAGANRWIRIEDYGRTLSGMRADGPVDVAGLVPGKDSPSLEYRMYLPYEGPATVDLSLSPTLNFVAGRGLRLALSFDDEAPKVIDILPANYNAANGNRDWEESVRNNARAVSSTFTLETGRYHTLKVWMVDPGVVVQKIVVRTPAAAKPTTYLGPPESFRK